MNAQIEELRQSFSEQRHALERQCNLGNIPRDWCIDQGYKTPEAMTPRP
jgi:hypothetical protein